MMTVLLDGLERYCIFFWVIVYKRFVGMLI